MEARSRTRIWLPAGLIAVAVALANGLAGDLDTTFNSTGKVLTDFPGMNPGDVTNDAAYDVAVDTRGRIVVAGRTARNSGPADFAVARYNADGTLDQSFGNAGKLVVDVGGDQVDDTADAVAIDGQGRIVVVGTSWRTGGFVRKIGILRLTEAGTLDAAFGTGGKVLLDFGEAEPNYIVADAVVDAADRVIVLSQAPGPSGDYDFGLTAVKDDGTLDASFGSSGRVFTDFTKAWCGDTPCPRSADFPVALAMDGHGRLVVGGNTQIGGINPNLALARYRADGTLDTTFISSVPSLQYQPGLIIRDLALGSDTDSYDLLYAMDVQDDVIVCAGLRLQSGSTQFRPVVMTFIDGVDWVGPITFDFGGSLDRVTSVQLAKRGVDGIFDGIYVAGTSDARNPAGNFMLGRLRLGASGFDPAFGVDGKVFTAFGNSRFENATSMTLDAAGKPIVAGMASAAADGQLDFAIARYKPASGADLTLTKSGPASAFPGDTLTYTMTVANSGPDTAQNVIVSDHLPTVLSFVSCSATAGGVCGVSGSDRTISFPSIPPGSSATVTLRATVPTSTPDGTTITNIAEATASPADPKPADNTATVTTRITDRADLFLTQRVAKLSNRQLSYTIDVANLGPYAARDLLMNDPMPNGTNFLSVSPGSWSCVPLPAGSVGTLSCRLGELQSGDTARIVLIVKTTAPGSVDINNTARVGSATFDPNGANNSATLVTRVSGK